MTRWTQGEAEIEQQLGAGDLQQVTGSRSNGAALLDKAQRTLDSARSIAAADPGSAYTLAYDAARHAGTALLAQQGLRPTPTLGIF